MAAPLDMSSTEAQPESVVTGMGKAIEGRSLGQIAWLRLKRDRWAMAGAIVVVVLILGALASLVLDATGVLQPNTYHPDLIDATYGRPTGAFGGISWAHPLGVDPSNGRDLLARILVGSQFSLLIAAGSTLLSVVIGVALGLVAGFAGGWVDTLISWLMNVFLAFPLLLFAIALSGVVQQSAFGLSGNALHVAVLIFVIGFFNWPYIGRIVRGQTLSLREREFVEAARSLGARGGYILRRELLPNLFAPILVYTTLLIPTNILFEAALSFLGVGLHPPTPSWGGMLSDAVNNGSYSADPEYVLVPGIAIFITVMAFNLLGDGLRDALDPRAR
ncbi:ABC transporter permease [Amycolatopsis sp. GM8]|uniref:ABC transporter permease n=1 Tax=Amycolatopsis sp. GM8 TaxID=2896530 RepID=UPI001F21D471|nr:ABC transporter permease [Amycolatopsis sp. GM8]